jgi:hypothetical protein
LPLLRKHRGVYPISSQFGTHTPPRRASQHSGVHIHNLDPGRNCNTQLRLDDAILALLSLFAPRVFHNSFAINGIRTLFKKCRGVRGIPPEFLKDYFNSRAILGDLSAFRRSDMQTFQRSFPLPTVCPPAADMLGFRLQKSPGPAPRRSQRCARPFPSVSLRHLLGAEHLSGKNEAKLKTRNA